MSKRDISSYDLWNSWRDYNHTGVDQSKGDSSVLSEDAREPVSPTLAEKDSAIVAEIGQLAQATRGKIHALPWKDPKRNPDGAPKDAKGVERGELSDLPDTTQELTQLYNYLISMGVSQEEATAMVANVFEMIPEAARAGATVSSLLEACGCGGGEKTSDSVPGMGRMLDYNEEGDSDEGLHARDQLMVINYLSGLLASEIHDEDDLPTWVQTYVTQAEMLVQKTFKYLLPHMDRAETEEARTTALGGDDGNIVVVTQSESTAPAPMKSRASDIVKAAVDKTRKTGWIATVSLADIFED
jgi:hypothetical protein